MQLFKGVLKIISLKKFLVDKTEILFYYVLVVHDSNI